MVGLEDFSEEPDGLKEADLDDEARGVSGDSEIILAQKIDRTFPDGAEGSAGSVGRFLGESQGFSKEPGVDLLPFRCRGCDLHELLSLLCSFEKRFEVNCDQSEVFSQLFL